MTAYDFCGVGSGRAIDPPKKKSAPQAPLKKKF